MRSAVVLIRARSVVEAQILENNPRLSKLQQAWRVAAFAVAHPRLVARTLRDEVQGPAPGTWPRDFDPALREIIATAKPYSMTTPVRLAALVNSIRFLSHAGIPGGIVECGVWRGGSMLAAALALKEAGDLDRELFLFDTYAGMVEPTERDRKTSGIEALKAFAGHQRVDEGSTWAYAELAEVQHTMSLSKYPAQRVHFVKGKVEDTIPSQAPNRIALLRLDTDWYESTRHELAHLVERVSPYGVVIVDDYGTWEGAQQAVDEYLANLPVPVMLHRIDHAGRTFIVPPEVSVHAA